MNMIVKRAEQEPASRRIAFALTPEAGASKPYVVNAAGARLVVGDRWRDETPDQALEVTMAARHGELHVTLAYRIDAYGKDDWRAVDALPTVLAVMVVPPVAFFAVEIDGVHGRGAYPIGVDARDAFDIRSLVLDPTAPKRFTMVGYGRGRIRSIKYGANLDRVWELLANGFRKTAPVFSETEFLGVLKRFEIPPQSFFAVAMSIHQDLPLE